MTPTPVSDLNHSAAFATTVFLSRFAPEEAKIVQPYIEQLFGALQNGHSFIRLNDAQAAELQQAGKIVGGSGNTPLVLQGRRLFLGRLWQLEHDLAKEIKRLATAETEAVDWLQAAQNLADWFGSAGSNGQRDAAALALLQPFMLITGGPGTGKTTTVAKLLGLICANSRSSLPRISLAAPTGKAAAHMAKALHRALDGFALADGIKRHLQQLEGQTVHRLLKLRPPQMLPAFDKHSPLPLDILVVDEASMLDISLLLQLLRALPDGCRVIFLGDPYQLPSVGVGAVLSALVQPTILDGKTHQELSGYLPQHGFTVSEDAPPLSKNTAHLSVSHRFGADSGIGCLARAVLAGEAEEAWAQFARFPDDLELGSGTFGQQAVKLYGLHEAYWQAVDKGDVALAYGHAADVVVLTAWRQDAEAFNQAYTDYLRRQARANGVLPYFAGQIIMISRNDYTLDLFNGDIGLIMPSAKQQDTLAAYFPIADGFKEVAISRLPEFETAFAMTVHKSQGSEYREVWLLPPSVPQNTESEAEGDALAGLNNALLYTGITRARNRFVFWGGQSELVAAVHTRKKRQTALKEMLEAVFRED
ncbi:exodeoxyribonuclease V subunit alpha [Neisseria animalis]|uniref:RecBCD enzyme subunit RecD n=1 Tax=Neisseria animalis TaxID=492 RepID=A0A5P3MTC8_NEIAN|nr:exodeoxyribonuclease V subunit alpha [Neisseria animalis]QEY24876.1 exodeoxyribonuclease V subunit alpha [Neisseria animalis]ROW32406.1 exodeoxyribonuclease V subunit alpha [Neisseria animalis]VEE08067.1 recombinase D [Neisseria animalis]